VIIVGEYWTSADIVDCIVSYTVTQLMDIMTDANSRDGAEMLARVSPSSTSCICSMLKLICTLCNHKRNKRPSQDSFCRASQQFLLLSHLYSQKADAAALARLRKELLRPKYTAMELALGSIVGVSAVGGITNCSITLFSCLVCLLPCTIKCQSGRHSLCRLPDIT